MSHISLDPIWIIAASIRPNDSKVGHNSRWSLSRVKPPRAHHNKSTCSLFSNRFWANRCFRPSWRFRYWNSLFGNELPITATLGGCILTTQQTWRTITTAERCFFVCSLWRVSTLHNGVNGMAGHPKPLAQADSWRLYRDLCELPVIVLLLYRQGKCVFVTPSMDAKQHLNIMCINPIWVFAPNHVCTSANGCWCLCLASQAISCW